MKSVSLAALMLLSMVPPEAGAALAAADSAGVPGDAGPSQATTHTVTIENVQYNPAHLTVHRGDRIVWINRDLFPHTVTATDKAFDSGAIGVAKSWAYQAKKPGTFTYACTFHPTMKGTIEVR